MQLRRNEVILEVVLASQMGVLIIGVQHRIYGAIVIPVKSACETAGGAPVRSPLETKH